MFPQVLLSAPVLETQVKEIPAGATAVLPCNSNDDQHNFLFWQLGQNQIIGPGNEYDHSKYRYEVLSGRLLIKGVTPGETGYYRCVSKHIDKGNLNIGAVEMIVKGNEKFQQIQSEIVENDDLEIVKIICIVISLVVLITCAVAFYKLRNDDRKKKNRLVMLAEDEDDEGSGDEIYNRTTVVNDAIPGPSKAPGKVEHISGIDNQGLDTDFNSVFEQISINVANRNLI